MSRHRKSHISANSSGCVPFLGDREGEAPLVESRANALIALKCCNENNRRADFLNERPHRAAV